MVMDMGFLKDFKTFAIKGNMVDLAIGVIIGAAFGRIITSLVDDLVMPLLNPLMPKGQWRAWVIEPGIKVGHFLSTAVDFTIVAIVIFLVVRVLHLRRERHEAAKNVGPSSTDQLLAGIHAELKDMRAFLERKG
ncbi:MAG: large conductance mechanosensitive channel protein MscL [Flavobacteriales bacterium]